MAFKVKAIHAGALRWMWRVLILTTWVAAMAVMLYSIKTVLEMW